MGGVDHLSQPGQLLRNPAAVDIVPAQEASQQSNWLIHQAQTVLLENSTIYLKN